MQKRSPEERLIWGTKDLTLAGRVYARLLHVELKWGEECSLLLVGSFRAESRATGWPTHESILGSTTVDRRKVRSEWFALSGLQSN